MRVDGNKPNLAEPIGKPIIHDVDILDASRSMRGGKYNNAVLSINKGVELLQTDTAVDYTKTIVEFSNSGWGSSNRSVITRHSFMTPLTESKFSPVGADGGTPLYDTVGIILTELQAKVTGDERVLVKIFTDGEDTGYRQWSPHQLKVLIDHLKSKGWTITFNGTTRDIDFVVNNLGIDRSNTLAHDNTAEGVLRTAQFRSNATMIYSKSVAAGVSKDELVSNFYSKTVNQD